MFLYGRLPACFKAFFLMSRGPAIASLVRHRTIKSPDKTAEFRWCCGARIVQSRHRRNHSFASHFTQADAESTRTKFVDEFGPLSEPYPPKTRRTRNSEKRINPDRPRSATSLKSKSHLSETSPTNRAVGGSRFGDQRATWRRPLPTHRLPIGPEHKENDHDDPGHK